MPKFTRFVWVGLCLAGTASTGLAQSPGAVRDQIRAARSQIARPSASTGVRAEGSAQVRGTPAADAFARGRTAASARAGVEPRARWDARAAVAPLDDRHPGRRFGQGRGDEHRRGGLVEGLPFGQARRDQGDSAPAERTSRSNSRGSLTAQGHVEMDRAERLLAKRLADIDHLRDIALQNGNTRLLEQADELELLARAQYARRTEGGEPQDRSPPARRRGRRDRDDDRPGATPAGRGFDLSTAGEAELRGREFGLSTAEQARLMGREFGHTTAGRLRLEDDGRSSTQAEVESTGTVSP